MGPMDRPAEVVPELVGRCAEGVLFQQLDRESVLLNIKTARYFGLDRVDMRQTADRLTAKGPLVANPSLTEAPRG